MKNKILPSLPCKKCLKRKADADDDGDDGIIHLVVGEDSKVGDILPLKGSRQVHVVLRGETNFYFGPKKTCLYHCIECDKFHGFEKMLLQTWAQMVDIMLQPFVGAAAPFLGSRAR